MLHRAIYIDVTGINPIGTALNPFLTSAGNLGYTDTVRNDDGEYVRTFDDTGCEPSSPHTTVAAGAGAGRATPLKDAVKHASDGVKKTVDSVNDGVQKAVKDVQNGVQKAVSDTAKKVSDAAKPKENAAAGS